MQFTFDGWRAAMLIVLHVITQKHNLYYSRLIYEKKFFASFHVFYAREFNFNLLNEVDLSHGKGEKN
jgi:hypothetical protein